MYDDPDHLDTTRAAPPAIMTVGGGVHYCLGAHLARLELIEALRLITQHMPNPRRRRPRAMEADHRDIWPDNASHRIRDSTRQLNMSTE